MENNIDNEKLLLEIDSLEDERNSSKKTTNNKNKFGLIIFLIILIGLSSLYFGNYNYENNYENADEEFESYIEKETDNRNKFESQKANIVIQDVFFSKNKELIVAILNGNNEPITDLKLEVIFYDDENKPIEIDSATLGILEKDTEAYLKFIETPEKFERYEFLISKDYYWYKNLEYVSDKISYETVENAEYTSLVVKNNYSKTISEIDFQIVYYDKNDNVIDVETVYVNEIKRNRTEKRELYLGIWDSNTFEEMNYRNYEIKLLGAYIY